MNWKLGKQSRKKLATCDRRLVSIVHDLAEVSPIDFTVLEGHRSVQRQQALYQQGATTIDGVTRLGKHNHSPSLAVDLAPWPIDWQDLRRFYVLAGAFIAVANGHGVAIRGGYDWNGNGQFDDQKFHDLPHFEIADG